MFSDMLSKVEFSLLEPQVDLVLRSLELYAYNLHYIGRNSVENYEYSNILLFHTYKEILAH